MIFSGLMTLTVARLSAVFKEQPLTLALRECHPEHGEMRNSPNVETHVHLE